MSELSSEARALVGDARGILRPTIEDRARIASRLAKRLGAAVILSPQVSFAAGKPPLVSKLSSLVAALGLLGATATYSLTRPAEVTPVSPSPMRAAVFPGATLPPSAPCVASPVQSAETELTQVPARSSVARKVTTNDDLGEEVDLLSRATSQLRGGNAAVALELLEQHRRQFPAGHLVEERRAARAQALCLLGDRGGAQVELTRLAQASPRSPHVARAQRACGL